MGTRFGVEKSKVEQHEDKDDQKEAYNKARKDVNVSGIGQDGEGAGRVFNIFVPVLTPYDEISFHCHELRCFHGNCLYFSKHVGWHAAYQPGR